MSDERVLGYAVIGGVGLIALIIVGNLVAGALKEPPKPKPCKDYTYSMSVITSDTAACKWPEQKMRLETRLIGKDLVHCTCPDVDAGVK